MLHMRSSALQLHFDFAGLGAGVLGALDEEVELEEEVELDEDEAGFGLVAGFLLEVLEVGLLTLAEGVGSVFFESSDEGSSGSELGASGSAAGAAAGGGSGAGACTATGAGASGLLMSATSAAAATAATIMDPPMIKRPVLRLPLGATERGAAGIPSGAIIGAPRGGMTLGATATGAWAMGMCRGA